MLLLRQSERGGNVKTQTKGKVYIFYRKISTSGNSWFDF